MPGTASAPKLLVSGTPKSGKTTVVTRLVVLLRQAGVPVGGFVTSEQRVDGRRVGFVVNDLAGPCAQLAHEDLVSPVQVGRFGVDVAAFELVALPALRAALDSDGVVIIDEVARMELASTAFTALVEEALTSPLPVVATVHAHAHPFTDALKHRPDVVVLDVDEVTRDELPQRLLATLTGQ
jgi:nucleoside-triphosphatase